MGSGRVGTAMRRGEIWWANLPQPWDRRPVLLLTRDSAYAVLTWVVVAPLTTNIRSIRSTGTLDPRADGVPRACAVTLDNLMAVNVGWIDDYVTRLTMVAVDEAIHFALSLSY